MSGWSYLALGILFEVAGTFCLKLSSGFANLLPSVLCFVFFVIALSLINLSAKTLDISTVYAVWSGAGVVLITCLGVLYFDEQMSPGRLFFIALILVGVLGLHSISTETDSAPIREQADVHTAE